MEAKERGSPAELLDLGRGPITKKRYRASDGQTLMSMSCVIIAAGALISVLTGYLQGADIAPILVTTGVGLFAVSVWWASSGKYLEAWIFGSLAGFSATYALLQFGIANSWFGIPFGDLGNLVSIYFSSWLFLFAILTLAVGRESVGMTAALLSMVVSLGLVLTANLKGSVDILHWAAIPLLVLVVVATIYIFGILNGWRKRDRGDRERAKGSRATSRADQLALQLLPSSESPREDSPSRTRRRWWVDSPTVVHGPAHASGHR